MFRVSVQNVSAGCQSLAPFTDRVVNHFLVQTVPFLLDTLAMLFHVCDPVNCGAYTHALVESPHRVVAGIQIRTVRRLQRGRNEKIMRRERDCF